MSYLLRVAISSNAGCEEKLLLLFGKNPRDVGTGACADKMSKETSAN